MYEMKIVDLIWEKKYLCIEKLSKIEMMSESYQQIFQFHKRDWLVQNGVAKECLIRKTCQFNTEGWEFANILRLLEHYSNTSGFSKVFLDH